MSSPLTAEIYTESINSSYSPLPYRIQYLDDTDPFSSGNLLEPALPLSFTFLTSTVLSNQLSSVHKALNAPHRVNIDSRLKKDKFS